jgi:hypothetical protein
VAFYDLQRLVMAAIQPGLYGIHVNYAKRFHAGIRPFIFHRRRSIQGVLADPILGEQMNIQHKYRWSV